MAKLRDKNGTKKSNNPSGGIPKIIFYPLVAILIIGLLTSSYFLYKYVSGFNDLKEIYAKQQTETSKYKTLYEKEAQLKSQEVIAKQQATAESEKLKTSLYYEQSESQSVKGQLKTTQSELDQTKIKVATVKTEVTDLLYTLNNLETFVKSNNKLSNTILTKIHSLCGSPITFSGSNCIIDTNKIGIDMGNCIGFKWVDDKTTSNFADGQRIFDPTTFWLSKEGDCDDFGLFMSAWLRSEYNIAKSTCSESNIYMKIKKSYFANPEYITCPCDFYAVGGCYGQGSSCHMETGISVSLNPYQNNLPNAIHVIEPQSGYYDGIASSTFYGGVFWIFTENDFLTLSKNKVISSIKSTKEKLNKIDLS